MFIKIIYMRQVKQWNTFNIKNKLIDSCRIIFLWYTLSRRKCWINTRKLEVDYFRVHYFIIIDYHFDLRSKTKLGCCFEYTKKICEVTTEVDIGIWAFRRAAWSNGHSLIVTLVNLWNKLYILYLKYWSDPLCHGIWQNEDIVCHMVYMRSSPHHNIHTNIWIIEWQVICQSKRRAIDS